MEGISFINANADVVVRNSDLQRNDPVYTVYDENWVDIGRCHNFAGMDCELIFEEAIEATYTKAAHPKQVYLKVNGPVELDPELDDYADPQFTVIPSRKGMETEVRQPIWVNSLQSFMRVKVTGSYVGRYEPGNRDVLWIECDEMEGFNE